jgi:hypothetical protein
MHRLERHYSEMKNFCMADPEGPLDEYGRPPIGLFYLPRLVVSPIFHVLNFQEAQRRYAKDHGGDQSQD